MLKLICDICYADMTHERTNAEAKLLNNVMTKDGMQIQQEMFLFCPACKDELRKHINKMKK